MKLNNLGPIRLMPLDTSSLFLPFGRPIADCARPEFLEFPVRIRWQEGAAWPFQTTGFEDPTAAAVEDVSREEAERDPAFAEFLPVEIQSVAPPDKEREKRSPVMVAAASAISRPRLAAMPLRPRMSYGPAPLLPAKPKPIPPPAPVVAKTPAARLAGAPAAAPKPPAAPSVKANAPAVVKPVPASVSKPAAVAPALGKSSAGPAAVSKTTSTPVLSPVQANAVTRPVEITPPVAVPDRPVVTVKPPVVFKAPAPAPKASAASPPLESSPASKQRDPARQKPAAAPSSQKEPAAIVPAPPVEIHLSSFERSLASSTAEQSGGFIGSIPKTVRFGAGVAIAGLAMYMVLGTSRNVPAPKSDGGQRISVGEQGWSTEWASDPGGSRRARQITLYRPSQTLSDYQMDFTGQIESKSLGWVFRATDTRNYYAMKIETVKPGSVALTRFAVVEGRESSYDQKRLQIEARPETMYRVKLEVSGPRFSVSVQGRPIDVWTDNRLKSGALGFMNEREDRGKTNSVQFSFPKNAGS